MEGNFNDQFSYYQSFEMSKDFGSDFGPKEKIQLNSLIKNGTHGAQYSVSIKLGYSKNEGNSVSLGQPQSETLVSIDGALNFSLSYVLDYYFERRQFLFITIAKNGKENFHNITIGQMMGSKTKSVSLKIEENEEFILSAQSLPNNNLTLCFDMRITGLKNKARVFIVLKKQKTDVNSFRNDNDLDYYKIKKSNVIKVSEGKFQDMKIPAMFACNGNNDHPLLIELYSAAEGQLVGSYKTTINTLMVNPSFQIESFQINCGVSNVTDYTFLDYLKSGVQISLAIAIDFTGSNLESSDTESLHYISRNPNQYQMAVRSVGDILAYYDSDQVYPVYGYGAIVPGQNQVNHCFPLNLSNDPNIKTIDGVLNTYSYVVHRLKFYGPTNFSPVINNLCNNIKMSNSNNVYYCLLIITDGEISDINETIHALVEASKLPLSVIIVGVGEDTDFKNMSILDSDGGFLTDKDGNKALRDLVQFVPFKNFINNPDKLPEQVLAEIPNQLCQYYRNNKIH